FSRRPCLMPDGPPIVRTPSPAAQDRGARDCRRAAGAGQEQRCRGRPRFASRPPGGGAERGVITEAQWHACADPLPMLEFLGGQASARKVRLFAVACCRSAWPHLYSRRSRHAVRLAERFADGRATAEESALAFDRAEAAIEDLCHPAVFDA